MKGYVRLILCLLVVLLAAVPVFAEEGEEVLTANGYQYEINEDGTVTILGSDLVYGDVVIPSELDGRTVTAIGSNAFQDTDSIVSVTIPGTVKTVDCYAFEMCEFLQSVTLEEGVTTLGRSAFGYCPLLESVHIPLSVSDVIDWKYGSNGPFRMSALQQVTFAPGRTEIPAYLFEGTELLKSIAIPDTVTTIGGWAFEASGLESVMFSGACNLTAIMDYAFSECKSLKELSFPEGLVTIYSHAFQGNESLTQVSFPATLRTIDSWAFQSCNSLTGVRLNEGLEAIGIRAFGSCANLTSAYIPSTLANAITWNYGDNGPFNGSGLSDVAFGEGTSIILEHLFEGTEHLKFIALPDTVTEIQNNAFQQSGLEAIRLSAGLQTIGAYAFDDCRKLNNPVFPEGLVTIQEYAFRNCQSLQSPRFPQSLRRIGEEAFENCDNIERAIFNTGLETLGRSAFAHCDRLFQTYIPASLKTVLTGRYGGNGPFTDSALRSVLFEEGVTLIPESLFDSCPKLKGLRLPDTITKIQERAFADCTALNDITMPWALESLEFRAFAGCTSLTRVAFAKNLTLIEMSAFAGCEDLTALFFSGPAPRMYTSVDFPQNAVLYYLEGQEGWTTPYYPEPEKALHPTAPIMGEPNLMDEDYLDKLAQHRFRFVDRYGVALDQVTVSFDGFSRSSGDADTMDCMIAGEDDTVITFTREGYHDLTLPLEVLSGISTIRLNPTSWTYPYVEGVYARDEDGFVYDLVNDHFTLFSLEKVELEYYVQVNWQSHIAEKVLLSATSLEGDGITTLQEGWNEPCTLDPERVQGKAPHLLMRTGVALISPQRLYINVTEAPKTYIIASGTPIQLLSDWLDPLFQPGEAQLGFDLFDWINVSYKTIGQDQFEVYVGIKPGDVLSFSDPTYLDNQFEKAMLGVENDTDSLADLLGSLGKTYELPESPNATARLLIECEGVLVGYGTGSIRYDEESGEPTLDLEKLSLGVELQGIFKGRQQMLVGTKPVYISSELNSKNSILVNTELRGESNELVPLNDTFSGTTSIISRAGLGWDQLLAAGVNGKINIEYTGPFSLQELPDLSVSANGSLGLDASILFLEFDVDLIKGEDVVLRTASSPLEILQNVTPETFDWKPQSRNYLNTAVVDAERSVMSAAAAPSVTGETLLSGVYPRAAVQMAELPDGRLLVVWVADDGTRTDTNRSALYYMVGDGESWSEPAVVDEDGTADFQPVLQVENDTVWLLWQDAAEALESYDLETTASLLDLSCARFDGEAFEVLGDFGTEGCYDGTMSLTVVDGQPSVAYTSNAANDIAADQRSVDLWRASWDGTAWVKEVLLEGLDSVDQTASMENVIWFTARTDTGRDLFRYDGKLTALTGDDLIDANPAVTDGTLIWFRDGALTDGEQEIPMESDSPRYQYLRSGNQEALIWAVTDAYRYSTLYASFRDGDSWGDPVVVDGGNGYIASFHGQLLSDGTLSVLVSERGVIKNATEEDPYALSDLTEAAELRMYRAALEGGLRLEGVDYISTTLVPEKPLVLQLELTNTGARSIGAVEVSILDGDTLLSKTVYAADLPSGRTELLLAVLPLGSQVPEQLTVTVAPIGVVDEDDSDNTGTVILNRTDLALEDAVAFADDNATTVTVLVANRGCIEIGETTLRLTDQNGTELGVASVQGLQPANGSYVTFHLDHPLESSTMLYITADEAADENHTANNRRSVAVTAAEKTPAGVVELSSVKADEAGTVTVTVTVSVQAEAVVMVASYDEKGRFLGIVMETVEAGTSTIAMDELVSGNTYQLFLLDSYEPLCGASPVG